ncbi:MAG: Ldh family oxidoreductase [Aquamicrobium sp.]|uniref:Ldh family oxidoreductase n=1 Tax=Aquamicrobium sp. TaxID=1872579 RepID=UPI00349E6A72|nr:Ldh family oxidoreductase [Aquamicrobium sp.]
MSEIVMTLDEIGSLTRRVLERHGLSTLQAEPIARIVIAAEADACRSHGLYRLPGYVAALRSGRVRPDAVPRVETVTSGIIRVDGDSGFAPAAAEAGRPALIEAARANGIAAMALTRCHHFSALWADLEPLTDAGLVAWAFVVGQSSVAPHGGTQRLMGTNPIAFGWPRPGREPFIFDFATSAAARGEVELKRLAGERLPEGWALGPDGAPTTDPAAALAGALLPFGGHKGSALSMMVELIAGPLIGEATSSRVAQMDIHDGGPPPGGELFIAIDPQRLAPGNGWTSEAEAFFAEAGGQPGLRLPSARRHAARARTRHEGVAVPAGLVAEVEALLEGVDA